VAKHYRTLLINDIGWADSKIGAWRDTGKNELAFDLHSADALKEALASLAKSGDTFDAAVFSTHGNKGTIFLDKDGIDYSDLYVMMVDDVDYSKLFPGHNTRILFGGCNVAESDKGGSFCWRQRAVSCGPAARRSAGRRRAFRRPSGCAAATSSISGETPDRSAAWAATVSASTRTGS
jgi:hypothetical protein